MIEAMANDERIILRLLDWLDRIFGRFPNGWGARDGAAYSPALLAPLHQGELRVRLSRLPRSASEQAMALIFAGNRGESGTHMMMKQAAKLWMQGEGAKDAAEEVAFFGGRADVLSLKRGWVAEVGHTHIRKLADTMACEDMQRFTLLPYRRFDYGFAETPRLLAIDFTWTKRAARHVREYVDPRLNRPVEPSALPVSAGEE